jgi:hypothetical protein
MASTRQDLPEDINALRAALIAERVRAAEIEAELAVARAKACDDAAVIAHQRLQIEKLSRQLYGHRSERAERLLNQQELAFEELESSASEDEIAAERAVAKTTNVVSFTRKRPARQPFPEHLPRERVGACCAVLAPLLRRVEAHVFAAARLHGDDTTVPVLAKGKTDTGRCWVYVRDDRPFGGQGPPAAMFYYSRDRGGEHPARHLVSYAGILQADAYGGYNKLYEAARKPGPIIEAACWVHARRPFFVLADVAANARRKAQGKSGSVISPLALEAVRRIDALFAIERAIQRRECRTAAAGPAGHECAADRRSRTLAARRAAETVARQRPREGHGLSAETLGGLHPLSRRWADLPLEQRGRTSAAWYRSRQKIMVVRGF